MRWSRRHKVKREGYHHGNLKQAMIDAALGLIAEKGPAGFSFAEAAREAGVSAAAPYRHFRDRDALIADIAREGFTLFAEKLERAWGSGEPDPMTALERTGRAYLEFARKEPAYYTAMFEAGIAIADHAELARAGDEAFQVLRRACEAVTATLPAQTRPPAMMMSYHVWSLAHGVASLFARGDASRRSLPVPPEELLEAGIWLYLQGAGAGKAQS